MKTSRRLGILIAPLVGAAGYALLVTSLTPSPEERTLASMTVAFALFVLPLSYLISISFGWPLLNYLMKKGRLSFWWFVVPSAPLGAIAFAVVLAALTLMPGVTVDWMQVGVKELLGVPIAGFMYGGFTAAAFCWVSGITAVPTDQDRYARPAAQSRPFMP